METEFNTRAVISERSGSSAETAIDRTFINLATSLQSQYRIFEKLGKNKQNAFRALLDLFPGENLSTRSVRKAMFEEAGIDYTRANMTLTKEILEKSKRYLTGKLLEAWFLHADTKPRELKKIASLLDEYYTDTPKSNGWEIKETKN